MTILLLSMPLPALADVDEPSLHAYARGRLADDDGALGMAVSSYRQALADDPGSVVVALRSYRQGIESGDMVLALTAAKVLDRSGALPRDGALLLTIEALIRKDWAAAHLLARRLEEEGNFAFVVPILASWISLAEGPYAPPAVDDNARSAPLTRRYLDEHVALQALALGNLPQAKDAVELALQDRRDRSGSMVGLRMMAAARLAGEGEREGALALLPADMPALARARSEILAGARPKPRTITPAQGVARLLARIGEDIGAGEARILAVALARFASFAAPASPEIRLSLARRLYAEGHPEYALIEAGKVSPQSWFSLAALDLRVDALMARERDEEALLLARQLASRADAGAAQHIRLANILADGKQFDQAVQSYRQARHYYTTGSVPWSLHLLEGSALERGGHWDEARKALEQAVDLAPEEPVVLNYLGYAQVERRQDVPAALRLLRKASALKPDDPSITDSLGWAHFISGDLATALPVLERAAAGAPDDATINEHLGDALWTAGRRYEARYAWAAASLNAEGVVADRIASKVREGLHPEYAAP